MMVAQMDEGQDEGRAPLWRMVRIALLGIALMFLGGVVAGMLAAHAEDGGGMPTLRFAAILAAALALIAACGWAVLRQLRQGANREPLTRKERLNRNILVGSALLGAAMGAGVLLSAEAMTPAAIISDAPLPPLVAAAFVAVFLIILPPLTLYWQKQAVDEQEIDAYKTGALYAVQVYMIAAPAWWFAWRGGFAPEPNGILLYMLVTFTMLIVWLGKKYA